MRRAVRPSLPDAPGRIPADPFPKPYLDEAAGDVHLLVEFRAPVDSSPH